MSTLLLSRAAARRGAINLNNCGVALLSRRLWCDALDAFMDAMCLMKIAMNEQGVTESEQDTQLTLHRTWQRTAIAFHPTAQAHQCPILKIVSSQCDPAAVDSFLSSKECPQGTKFVVTIDPIDPINVEEWDTDATDLESTFMLYNFGITHGLLSFVSGCDYASSTLSDNSYRILQLTQTLAINIFGKALDKTHLCNPIMLINMLLTVNLMQISFHNDPAASEGYGGSLQELLSLINAHQKLLPLVDYKFAPAA